LEGDAGGGLKCRVFAATLAKRCSGVTMGSRLIVTPDVILSGSARGHLIYDLPEGGPSQVLYPIPEPQHEHWRRAPNAMHITIETPRVMPGEEAKRPGRQTPATRT
jgi:hypothetical protein